MDALIGRLPPHIADRAVAVLVAIAALLSGWLILRVVDRPLLAAAFAGGVIALGAMLLLVRHLYPPRGVAGRATDWSLVRDAADNATTALAVTDRRGRMVCSNALYDGMFGAVAPPDLATVESAMAVAGKSAWRDGAARIDVRIGERPIGVSVLRGGLAEDCLVWRLALPQQAISSAGLLEDALAGAWGDRLGSAGIMAAIITGAGRVRVANRVLVLRAQGRIDAPIAGRDFVALLQSDENGTIRFAHEGSAGLPLRLLQIPLGEDPDRDEQDTDRLIVLLDAEAGAGGGQEVPLQTLLSMLPLGLALADRDGRFLFTNTAFLRAAGISSGKPVYPGDLVVREDKAAVADAVRRHAGGHVTSGDLAVRLRDRPDDPVALTIAGARGLGDAAVLLSLKDNSDESKLQRQVAQQTKMQAVGQLAGGVAHDFNNILTAILGYCDLMLMRHTPGDSDYDDIQQIRSNSNRAAGLTRQLLAFSRQQTLRPEIVQLPDVVAEVSHLLKRLLDERVELVIAHGRALGAIRADPGQLEQVIMNLVVNARDAILAEDDRARGTVTLTTYAVAAAEVRALGTDVLPVGDYTAMSVADTGAGIAPEIVGKIFEPFFTTKDKSKGTGLGLSTVYGIVKQSGGFIFADSKPGEGAVFTVYLPVHAPDTKAAQPIAPQKTKASELWGNATILLVEDEDMVRAVAERALVRHGYTVLTAGQGEEAMAILDAGKRIDLIVSDVVMPTMDGPTLGRTARAKFPGVPILFMSGYAEEQLRRSIDLPRMGFLPKPFTVKALAEAVKATLALEK